MPFDVPSASPSQVTMLQADFCLFRPSSVLIEKLETLCLAARPALARL